MPLIALDLDGTLIDQTSAQIASRAPLPMVATLGAWTVFTADLLGLDGTDLRLRPAGEWSADFEGTWLPIENGPMWTIWGAPATTPPRADPLSARYHEQLEAEREEKRLYSTARHRSLARKLFAAPLE